MGDRPLNEMKLNLKLIIDKKAKKVVFVEAGKDFVDFMIHMLSLPLTTVVKLINDEKEMAGGLRTLYKSVESLNAEYFDKNVDKDTMLKPKYPVSLPLLSVSNAPSNIVYYKCKCPSHDYASDRQGAVCPRPSYAPGSMVYCNRPLDEMVSLPYVVPKIGLPGYVKETVAYMVMDNLEVHPMSITRIKSVVSDFDFIEEKEVKFGRKEGIALLRASLETSNVLTTVFLGTKRERV